MCSSHRGLALYYDPPKISRTPVELTPNKWTIGLTIKRAHLIQMPTKKLKILPSRRVAPLREAKAGDVMAYQRLPFCRARPNLLVSGYYQPVIDACVLQPHSVQHAVIESVLEPDHIVSNRFKGIRNSRRD